MTQFYIGTKLVEAWPQTKVVKEEGKPDRIEDGYAVKYPDGYTSWSPKAVFEAAYLPMGNVVPTGSQADAAKVAAAAIASGDTVPVDKVPTVHFAVNDRRVTQQMVTDFVAHWSSVKVGEKTTVVTATLVNGFEITASSSCVDPAMYDHGLGEQLCQAKVLDKVWELLGFLLQTARNGVKAVEKLAVVAPTAGPMFTEREG